MATDIFGDPLRGDNSSAFDSSIYGRTASDYSVSSFGGKVPTDIFGESREPLLSGVYVSSIPDRKTFADAFKEVADKPYSIVPYLNAIEINDSYKVKKAADAVQRGFATEDQKILLSGFLQERQRESTFGYKVWNLVFKSIPFAFEFMTIGGWITGPSRAIALSSLKASAKKAATMGGTRALARQGLSVKPTTAGYSIARYFSRDPFAQTAKAFARWKKATPATSSAAQRHLFKMGMSGLGRAAVDFPLRTALMPHRVINESIKNQTPEYALSENEYGVLEAVLTDEGDDFWPAFGKAFADIGIENFSENTGQSLFVLRSMFGKKGATELLKLGALNKRARDIARRLPFERMGVREKHLIGLKKALKTHFISPDVYAPATFQRFARRAGWHGVLAEMFEERVGQAIRIPAGLEPVPTGGEFLEQLATEAVGFAINPIALGGMAADKTVQLRSENIKTFKGLINRVKNEENKHQDYYMATPAETKGLEDHAIAQIKERNRRDLTLVEKFQWWLWGSRETRLIDDLYEEFLDFRIGALAKAVSKTADNEFDQGDRRDRSPITEKDTRSFIRSGLGILMVDNESRKEDIRSGKLKIDRKSLPRGQYWSTQKEAWTQKDFLEMQRLNPGMYTISDINEQTENLPVIGELSQSVLSLGWTDLNRAENKDKLDMVIDLLGKVEKDGLAVDMEELRIRWEMLRSVVQHAPKIVDKEGKIVRQDRYVLTANMGVVGTEDEFRKAKQPVTPTTPMWDKEAGLYVKRVGAIAIHDQGVIAIPIDFPESSLAEDTIERLVDMYGLLEDIKSPIIVWAEKEVERIEKALTKLELLAKNPKTDVEETDYRFEAYRKALQQLTEDAPKGWKVSPEGVLEIFSKAFKHYRLGHSLLLSEFDEYIVNAGIRLTKRWDGYINTATGLQNTELINRLRARGEKGTGEEGVVEAIPYDKSAEFRPELFPPDKGEPAEAPPAAPIETAEGEKAEEGKEKPPAKKAKPPKKKAPKAKKAPKLTAETEKKLRESIIEAANETKKGFARFREKRGKGKKPTNSLYDDFSPRRPDIDLLHPLFSLTREQILAISSDDLTQEEASFIESLRESYEQEANKETVTEASGIDVHPDHETRVRAALTNDAVKIIKNSLDGAFKEQNGTFDVLYKISHNEPLAAEENFIWQNWYDELDVDDKVIVDSVLTQWATLTKAVHARFNYDYEKAPDAAGRLPIDSATSSNLKYSREKRGYVYQYMFTDIEGKTKPGLLQESHALKVILEDGSAYFVLDGVKNIKREIDGEGGEWIVDQFGGKHKKTTDNLSVKHIADIQRYLWKSSNSAQLAKRLGIELKENEFFIHLQRLGDKDITFFVAVPKTIGTELQERIDKYVSTVWGQASEKAKATLLVSPEILNSYNDRQKNEFLGRHEWFEKIHGKYWEVYKSRDDFNKRSSVMPTPGVTGKGRPVRYFIYDDSILDADFFDGMGHALPEWMEQFANDLGPVQFTTGNDPNLIKAHIIFKNKFGNITVFKPMISNIEQVKAYPAYKQLMALMKKYNAIAIPKSSVKVNGIGNESKVYDVIRRTPEGNVVVDFEGEPVWRDEIEGITDGSELDEFTDDSVYFIADFNYDLEPAIRNALTQWDSIRLVYDQELIQKALEFETRANDQRLPSVALLTLHDLLSEEGPYDETGHYSRNAIINRLSELGVTHGQIMEGIDRINAVEFFVSRISKMLQKKANRFNRTAIAQGSENRNPITFDSATKTVRPSLYDVNVEGYMNTEDILKKVLKGNVFNTRAQLVKFLEDGARTVTVERKRKDGSVEKILLADIIPWMYEINSSGNFIPIDKKGEKLRVNTQFVLQDKNTGKWLVPGAPAFVFRVPSSGIQFGIASFIHKSIGDRLASIAMTSRKEGELKSEDYDADSINSMGLWVNKETGKVILSDTPKGNLNKAFLLMFKAATTYTDAVAETMEREIDLEILDADVVNPARQTQEAEAERRGISLAPATHTGQVSAWNIMRDSGSALPIGAASSVSLRFLNYLKTKGRQTFPIDPGLGLLWDRSGIESITQKDILDRDHFWGNELINFYVDDVKLPRIFYMGHNRHTVPLVYAIAAGTPMSVKGFDALKQYLINVSKFLQSKEVQLYSYLMDIASDPQQKFFVSWRGIKPEKPIEIKNISSVIDEYKRIAELGKLDVNKVAAVLSLRQVSSELLEFRNYYQTANTGKKVSSFSGFKRTADIREKLRRRESLFLDIGDSVYQAEFREAVETTPAPTPAPAPSPAAPVAAPDVGINIASQETGLGGQLTNFARIPVMFRGTQYSRAEDAYQKNKGKQLDDATVLALMTEVITAKLEQHPNLVQDITDRGGAAFLEASTHELRNKKDRWTGQDGLFMQALRAAYATAAPAAGSVSWGESQGPITFGTHVLPFIDKERHPYLYTWLLSSFRPEDDLGSEYTSLSDFLLNHQTAMEESITEDPQFFGVLGKSYSKLQNDNIAKAIKDLKREIDNVVAAAPAAAPAAHFLGYRGGFEGAGKGKAEGDGKDKAMRAVANAFVGELINRRPSSTLTSAKEIAAKHGLAPTIREKLFTGSTDSRGVEYPGSHNVYVMPKSLDQADEVVVMLARNGELKGAPLKSFAAEAIRSFAEYGKRENKPVRFVIGDMPGVDDVYMLLLEQLGATFEIYHTGEVSRIKTRLAEPATAVPPAAPAPFLQEQALREAIGIIYDYWEFANDQIDMADLAKKVAATMGTTNEEKLFALIAEMNKSKAYEDIPPFSKRLITIEDVAEEILRPLLESGMFGRIQDRKVSKEEEVLIGGERIWEFFDRGKAEQLVNLWNTHNLFDLYDVGGLQGKAPAAVPAPVISAPTPVQERKFTVSNWRDITNEALKPAETALDVLYQMIYEKEPYYSKIIDQVLDILQENEGFFETAAVTDAIVKTIETYLAYSAVGVTKINNEIIKRLQVNVRKELQEYEDNKFVQLLNYKMKRGPVDLKRENRNRELLPEEYEAVVEDAGKLPYELQKNLFILSVFKHGIGNASIRGGNYLIYTSNDFLLRVNARIAEEREKFSKGIITEAQTKFLATLLRTEGKIKNFRGKIKPTTALEAAAPSAATTTTINFTAGLNTELSTFDIAPFEFRGEQFFTVEAAYQAWKSGEYVEGFNELDGQEARNKGKDVDGNKKYRPVLLEDILRNKFLQVQKFKDALMASGNIEHPGGDVFMRTIYPQLLTKIREDKKIEDTASGTTNSLLDFESAVLPNLERALQVGIPESEQNDYTKRGMYYRDLFLDDPKKAIQEFDAEAPESKYKERALAKMNWIVETSVIDGSPLPSVDFNDDEYTSRISNSLISMEDAVNSSMPLLTAGSKGMHAELIKEFRNMRAEWERSRVWVENLRRRLGLKGELVDEEGKKLGKLTKEEQVAIEGLLEAVSARIEQHDSIIRDVRELEPDERKGPFRFAASTESVGEMEDRFMRAWNNGLKEKIEGSVYTNQHGRVRTRGLGTFGVISAPNRAGISLFSIGWTTSDGSRGTGLVGLVSREHERARRRENEYIRKLGIEEWIAYHEDYIKHRYRARAGIEVSDEVDREIRRAAKLMLEETGTAQARTYATFLEAARKAGLLPQTMRADMLYEMRARELWAVAARKMSVNYFTTVRDEMGIPQFIPFFDLDYKGSNQILSKSSVRYLANNILAAVRGLGGKYRNKIIDPRKSLEANINELGDILRKRVKELTKDNKEQYVSIPAPEGLDSIITFYSMKGDATNLSRMLLDKRWDSNWMIWISTFNQISKYAGLALSIFHPVALVESLIAAQGLIANPKEIKRTWVRFFEVRKMIKEGRYPIEPWIRAGLEASMTSKDVENTTLDEFIQKGIDKARDNAAGKAGVPGTSSAYWSKVAKGAEVFFGIKRWWDRLLWEDMHPAFKLFTAERVLARRMSAAMARGEVFDEHLERVKIAQYVNNAFGGQEFERYRWATPKARQLMHLFIFAPDWTLSAWNVAGGGNIPFIRDVLDNRPTNLENEEAIKQYWPAMAGIVLFAIPNALQALLWAVSGDDDEEDKPFNFMNERGKRSHIDITPMVRKLGWFPWIGYEGDETGKRRIYMRFGKQAFEVFEGWLVDPVDRLLTKSSTVTRIAIEQSTGSTAAGWELPFKDEGFTGWLAVEGDWWNSRSAYIVKKFIPFSILAPLDGSPSTFIAPTSRGASKSRTATDFARVLEAYANQEVYDKIKDVPSRKTNLAALGPGILEAAARNGWNIEEIMTRARSKVLTKLYGEFYDALNKNQTEKMEKKAISILRVNAEMKNIIDSVEKRLKSANKEIDQETIDKIEKLFE